MKKTNIQIRETKSDDFNDIMIVEERAFGYVKEAQLTADLLKDNTAKPILSLLALNGKQAIGHILFTRVYIDEMDIKQPLMHILAPLAVIPEYQKQGIGGLLIKEGLRILAERGTEMVFVLGHMDYYPKFGFIPDAKKLGFSAPFPIPSEYSNAWMVQSLNPKGFIMDKGNVICCDKLNKEEHWRE
ncbi:GNAT family N-acetyltransferase [Carboxylicivirga sp. N1Y90]|uniref:GNAT family N-acetyltransferase n=1 Tax=Carboxylicivirga fragile TaxID=3417571 RepID=UPI003D337C90|nr:N-acetyltransferase [Marinilabiliaceae bacterium N1Y90]